MRLFYSELSVHLFCFGFLLHHPKPLRKRSQSYLLFVQFAGGWQSIVVFNGLHLSSPLNAALIMVCTPILVLLIKTISGVELTKLQWIGLFVRIYRSMLSYFQSIRYC